VSLEAYLNQKKSPLQNMYRGLFLVCNLVDMMRLREDLILT
jgi:hypothetical protein